MAGILEEKRLKPPFGGFGYSFHILVDETLLVYGFVDMLSTKLD
jgi:hypothetical protein